MNKIITQCVWNNNHQIKITDGHPGQHTDSYCVFICQQCNREVNEYLINGIDQGTNQTGMCIHCLRRNKYENMQSNFKFSCTTCGYNWVASQSSERSSLPCHECPKCGESLMGTVWSDGTGGGIKYEMMN